FVGILLFTFHLFERPPVFFAEPTLAAAHASALGPELEALEDRWDEAFEVRRDAARAVVEADTPAARAALRAAHAEMDDLRAEAKAIVGRAVPGAELKDSDHIFVSFVMKHLPPGLVGLLLAVILM